MGLPWTGSLADLVANGAPAVFRGYLGWRLSSPRAFASGQRQSWFPGPTSRGVTT